MGGIFLMIMVILNSHDCPSLWLLPKLFCSSESVQSRTEFNVLQETWETACGVTFPGVLLGIFLRLQPGIINSPNTYLGSKLSSPWALYWIHHCPLMVSVLLCLWHCCCQTHHCTMLLFTSRVAKTSLCVILCMHETQIFVDWNVHFTLHQ